MRKIKSDKSKIITKVKTYTSKNGRQS